MLKEMNHRIELNSNYATVYSRVELFKPFKPGMIEQDVESESVFDSSDSNLEMIIEKNSEDDHIPHYSIDIKFTAKLDKPSSEPEQTSKHELSLYLCKEDLIFLHKAIKQLVNA